ncbi:MAG: hypothetical protein HYZ28_22905 [Myxococcales bacterium]|nr:hypothetical protein [Myxococcales bacterium]
MKLDVSVEIPYPREKVFTTYRDKLPELVPYLPNVRGITVSSRSEEGQLTKLLNRWKGGGELPGVVRKLLSDDMLEWDDYATWNQEQFTCEWRTVVPAFKDAVRSEGKNRFEDLGGSRTRLVIAGMLEVDAAKIRLVPRLLAGTVGPTVEKFLVGSIKPNLVAVSKGVEKYLDAHR